MVDVNALFGTHTVRLFGAHGMPCNRYTLHQLAMDLEAAGTRVWLRDKHDNKVCRRTLK